MAVKVQKGDRFGTWTVLGPTGRNQKYKCECDCGVQQDVRVYDLTKGKSTMCKACATSVSKRGHGTAVSSKVSSEYNSYIHMIQRCHNEKNKDYARYGGRGITVCDMWRESFEAFYMSMGPKPEGYTIERVDSNGNYEPSNCRWASRAEQTRNKGDNIKVEIDGQTRTVSEWAKEDWCPVNAQIVYKRISRGWDPIRALKEPSNRG